MIFFFNANGDLLKGNPDTVYQGSSNAGKIYAVAPLNARMIADIYFTLPNGDEAGPYLLTNGGTVIEEKELPEGYALWFINLNSNLTQYAGDLTAQIGFYASEDMTTETADGVAKKTPIITTQAFNITIARGVARTLPAEPTNDIYEQIVNTLTLLAQDINKIASVYPPASIKDIGEAAVTYDTTDGVTLKTTEQWTGADGETFDIETERELPIKGGKGIAIDVTEDGKFVEVKSTDDPIEQDEKGKPGGVPTLDSNGQIPASQLPTYVDDVIDGYVVGATPFAADWLSKTPNGTPLTPEKDKIYIVVSEGEYINIEYRWSGTVYAELGKTTPLSDTTGQGTNIGMTQKAITDELAKKQDKLAIYTVNTEKEVTIPADDLAKIIADPNAIIVEVDSTRPSVETRFYKKGIDFIGGTVFVSIYTVSGTQTAEGCLIAFRGLSTTTGVLTARHETNATSLAEVRQEIEGKYLSKPTDNPTEDSLVKVSSAGTSSWKPVSDFLEKKTNATSYDQVYWKSNNGTNMMRNVRTVPDSYVMPIYNGKGQLKTNAPDAELDCINKKYIEDNYNANPELDGTEAELTGVTLNGTKYKVPSGGGSVVVEITSPASATSGTLTAEQLSTLQASNDNYIIFNDEIYRLADKEHTTGVLSYTHNGWNGTAMQDKSINITISTLAWTLVVGQNALIKPEGNPTQDSVVKVSSTGTTSYEPIVKKYLHNIDFEVWADFGGGHHSIYPFVTLLLDTPTPVDKTTFLDTFKYYGDETGGKTKSFPCSKAYSGASTSTTEAKTIIPCKVYYTRGDVYFDYEEIDLKAGTIKNVSSSADVSSQYFSVTDTVSS